MYRAALGRLLAGTGWLSVAVLVGAASSAADLAPPAPLNVPVDAREISASETVTAPAGRVGSQVKAQWSQTKTRRLGGGEVWREKGGAPRRTSAGSGAFADGSSAGRVLNATVSSSASLGSLVRTASENRPVDPLEDPFGDKSKDRVTPAFTSAVSDNLASPSNSPAPPLAAPAPVVPDGAAPRLAPPMSEAPEVVPPKVTPAPPVLAPIPPASPATPSVPPADASSAPRENGSSSRPMPFEERPKNTRYNGRDCNDELNGCQVARDFVKAASIRKISLDITPGHTLAKLDGSWDQAYEQQVEQNMERVPSREFRDRQGRVIAEGRMRDFRHGRVLIEDPSGKSMKIPFADLSEEDACFVTSWWSIPTECALDDSGYDGRQWTDTTLAWKASAVCSKPLYFEEVQLERYGHSAGPFVQPVLSTAHFFGSIAALPYSMGIHPPTECRYPLGYYRPGSCAPWLVPPIPLSLRGGLMAAGAYVGGVFIIP